MSDPEELTNDAAANPRQFEGMKRRLLAWSDVYGNRELADIITRLTSAAPPASAERTGAAFDNGVELVAIDFGERRVSADDSPDLQFYLRTAERVRADCEIRFFLVDGEGDDRFESSHPPVNGTFPLRQWPLGRIVDDGYGFELRSKLMTKGRVGRGEYDARIGLVCDGKEIPAVSGDVDDAGRVRAGKFQVAKRAKSEEASHGRDEEQ